MDLVLGGTRLKWERSVLEMKARRHPLMHGDYEPHSLDGKAGTNMTDSGYGIAPLLLDCMSQEVALSGHRNGFRRCPLSG